MALSLWSRPIDQDEGQYVAAIALMRHGLPYRDFAYLQTPLQPVILAPLAWLPAGILLLTARIANALFAGATLALLATGCGLITARSAMISASAMATTDTFLFAGSVARNDALPMMLLMAAVVLLLPAASATQRTFGRMLTGGLALGLAASAKISFALPALGAGAFFLAGAWRGDWKPVGFLLLGGLAGLAPSIVFASLSPREFQFDVFEYSLQAPQQWLRSLGRYDRLFPANRLVRLLGFAAMGPTLIAIAAIVKGRRTAQHWLLDAMILLALVAVYLPVPPYRQYLAPLLPPLFARFAMKLDDLAMRKQYFLLSSALPFAIIGLFPTVINIVNSLAYGSPIVQVVDQAAIIAELAKGARIVTLSPERIAGGNTQLDSRFVTGPFLYKTNDTLASDALRFGHSLDWRHTDLLSGAPPAILLLGAQGQPHLPFHPNGLDDHLRHWAVVHHYRDRPVPGGLTLWLRPLTNAEEVGG